MKPSETEEIYKNACLSKRVVPQPEECRMWHKALAMFEVRDVRAAIDAWWASTERDSQGELRSRFLPAPGDLIPLVQSQARKRLAGLNERKELVRWRCQSCGMTACDFRTPGDERTPRCQGLLCDGTMVVEFRDAA